MFVRHFSVLLPFLLGVASAGTCPYAPKQDKPPADAQDPKCVVESPGIQELNARFQEYCDHYQFKDNGTGETNVCITSKEQYRTEEQKGCMGDFSEKCIGPLANLIGRWEGEEGLAFTMVPNYDTHKNGGKTDETNREFKVLPYGAGRVPQQPLSDMSSFKQTYREILTFEPILGGVKNRGLSNADQVNAECQQNQVFQGLVYKLKIIQTSPNDLNGGKGGILHEENGMYMYNSIPAQGGGTGYDIVKMMVVPHGITVTSPGNHSTFSDSDNLQCDLVSQQQGVDLITAPQPFGVCVPDTLYTPAPSNGLPTNLNPALTNQTEKFSSLSEFTHMRFEEFSQSSTPFIMQQANTKEYAYDMWISKIMDEDGKEKNVLQYAQTSKFEFMTRLECLDCEGVVTRNEKECITGCAGFESMIFNGTGLINGSGDQDVLSQEKREAIFGPVEGKEYIPGSNFNEIPGQLHGQCFSCAQSNSPDRGLAATGKSCAEQPLILWPHLQANTLVKVSDDPNYDWNSLKPFAASESSTSTSETSNLPPNPTSDMTASLTGDKEEANDASTTQDKQSTVAVTSDMAIEESGGSRVLAVGSSIAVWMITAAFFA